MMEKSKSFPECSSSTGHHGCNNPNNSKSDLNAYSFNGPKVKVNAFGMQNDPEIKRKKRVASYKVLTMEGKVKSSMRNSFRWLKNKYTEMRYGW